MQDLYSYCAGIPGWFEILHYNPVRRTDDYINRLYLWFFKNLFSDALLPKKIGYYSYNFNYNKPHIAIHKPG